VGSIPERRPDERADMEEKSAEEARGATGEIRVWRCKVCGYLCARTGPPEVCPICKVSRDRFEPFRFP
jgi:rubrerythrin